MADIRGVSSFSSAASVVCNIVVANLLTSKSSTPFIFFEQTLGAQWFGYVPNKRLFELFPVVKIMKKEGKTARKGEQENRLDYFE